MMASILPTRYYSKCPVVKSCSEAYPLIKFNNAVITLFSMICKGILECQLCKGSCHAAPSLHSLALLTITHLKKKNKSEIYFSLSCLQILIYIAKHFTAANGETSPLLTQALCYSLQNPIEIKSTCIQSECGPWSMAEHTLKTTAHILKYIFPCFKVTWLQFSV